MGIRVFLRKLRTGSAAARRGVPASAIALCLAAVAWPSAASDDLARDLGAAARREVGADQGVHVETEDGTVLVSQAASRAVHPASVSKIPTTLALLRELGPTHRFATRFVAAGPIAGGTVAGDLVAESEGDPFFVDENAILVALALRERGVERVAGGLRVSGPFLFDWRAEGAAAGLRRVLSGEAPEAAWSEVARLRLLSGPAPAIRFGAGGGGEGESRRVLVVHRSQPLVPLVKALNGFSNNIFHPFAGRVGGVAVVERIARESVPLDQRDEIVLTNGAGAGATNRLSPRATVSILRALVAELSRHGLGLADVLPVSGVDAGTLRERLDGPGERGVVAGKTGTYGDYGASALAGAYRSRDRGLVYFAVLNRGVPVPVARGRQDAFVRALLGALPGEAWPYTPDESPAVARASISDE